MAEEKKHYEFFRAYNAIKLHYSSKSKYDYIKYNGKSKRLTPKHFEELNNKWGYIKAFQTLTKANINPFNFVVVLLFYDPEMWIGNLVNTDTLKKYKDFQKTFQALTYHFKNDIKMVYDQGGDFFPNICEGIMTGKIHPLTFIVLDHIFDMKTRLEMIKYDDMLWSEVSYRLYAMSKFLTFNNLEAFKKTLIESTKNE